MKRNYCGINAGVIGMAIGPTVVERLLKRFHSGGSNF
jgi:hypothetical protein